MENIHTPSEVAENIKKGNDILVGSKTAVIPV